MHWVNPTTFNYPASVINFRNVTIVTILTLPGLKGGSLFSAIIAHFTLSEKKKLYKFRNFSTQKNNYVWGVARGHEHGPKLKMLKKN